MAVFIICGAYSWQHSVPQESAALSIVDTQLVLNRCLGTEMVGERLGYTPDL